jgi:hypothetical protein
MFSKIHLGSQIEQSCECASRFKILDVAYSFPRDVVKSSRTCIVVSKHLSEENHLYKLWKQDMFGVWTQALLYAL